MARITVHVTPRSGKDQVTGWRGAELGVRVTAPPEGGKANTAVEQVIARALGVPKSSVKVVRGQSARVKTLEIGSMDDASIRAAFGEPDMPLF